MGVTGGGVWAMTVAEKRARRYFMARKATSPRVTGSTGKLANQTLLRGDEQ
jgi:hypothetical protein